MSNSSWFSTSNDNIEFQIRVTENSQSISNNTSSVTVKVFARRTNTGYTTYGTGTVYCTINGKSYTSSITSSDTITSTARELFSRTVTVGHNADGTKTLSTNARISHSQFSSSSRSFNEDLTTIPRASTFSLSETSVTLNGSSAVKINITRASTSFTHRVTWRFNSSNAVIDSGIATSVSRILPSAWVSLITNATYSLITVTVETLSGSSVIGSVSKTLQVTVPSAIKPNPGTLNIEHVRNGVPNDWPFIQGISQLNISLSGSGGSEGSTITSRKITAAGQSSSGTATSLNGVDLPSAGTVTITATVTDSRGRTATTSTSITVEAYATPRITSFTAVRSGANGTQISLTARGSFSNVGGKNSVSRITNYRVVGAAYWISANTAWSQTGTTVMNVAPLSTDTSYQVRVIIQDALGASGSMDVVVPTELVTMDFRAGGKGVAIGKVSEGDIFDVNIPTRFRGAVSFDQPVTGYEYDTGWVTPSIHSAWQANSTFMVRRVGNVVWMRGNLQPDTGTIEPGVWRTPVATLAEEFRPNYITRISITIGDGGWPAAIRIEGSGAVSVINHSAQSLSIIRPFGSYRVN